jgi:hypothetical protein
MHPPPWHFSPAAHVLPQIPQLALSFCRFTHVPEQFDVPPTQQTPPVQTPPQGRSHPPQCWRLELVLTQTPLQLVSLARQQMPCWQLSAQVLPHIPQFVLSLFGSTHVLLQ